VRTSCHFEQSKIQLDFSRDKNNINKFWTFKNATLQIHASWKNSLKERQELSPQENAK
jgi:hypothetical protein